MQSILDECEGKTEDPADCEEIFDFIQEECASKTPAELERRGQTSVRCAEQKCDTCLTVTGECIETADENGCHMNDGVLCSSASKAPVEPKVRGPSLPTSRDRSRVVIVCFIAGALCLVCGLGVGLGTLVRRSSKAKQFLRMKDAPGDIPSNSAAAPEAPELLPAARIGAGV
jgi:hypothetical protein